MAFRSLSLNRKMSKTLKKCILYQTPMKLNTKRHITAKMPLSPPKMPFIGVLRSEAETQKWAKFRLFDFDETVNQRNMSFGLQFYQNRIEGGFFEFLPIFEFEPGNSQHSLKAFSGMKVVF